MKAMSDFLLNIMGWEITNHIPQSIKKAVIIVAPHTSLWDTIIGKLGFWHMEIDSRILIKKEAFAWPHGGLLRMIGGMRELFYPTGDYEKDIVEIQSFYKGIEGKNPGRSRIFN